MSTSPVNAPKTGEKSDSDHSYRVLIVSASMGAGHDGAAKELARRLEARGHHSEVHDFLSAFPIGIGWFFRWLYGRMLALAPWSYDALYKVFPSVYTPFSFLEHHITGRRLRKWVRNYKPDVIVSTYPIGSIAMGRMRLHGKLHTPVITYITDFFVHPLVTHEGVDLHLAIHETSKRDAMKRVSGAVRRVSPLVSSRFTEASDDRRAEVRNALQINDDQNMILIVAGSWGAGEVEATALDLASSPDLMPVVVCGRNTELVERLRQHKSVRAIGWNTEMPSLMAAADVLVDNAGGLTAMEGLAVGLPVVNYRPLAGHGRDNANDMANAGVVTVAHTRDEFVAALRELGGTSERRNFQIQNGLDLYDVDATDDVLAYASGAVTPLAPVVAITAQRPARRKRMRRLATGVAIAGLTVSMGLTTGVGEAAAHGVGSDNDNPTATYVGVRVTSAELSDPAVVDMLSTMPVTLIVDGPTAAAHADTVRQLATAGVSIANGGSGQHDPGWTPWTRARLDLEQATNQVDASTGVKTKLFVPGRRIDGFDLLFSKRMHQHAIPTAKSVKLGNEVDDLSERGIYIIDGRNETVPQFETRLNLVKSTVATGHVEPLANLI